LIGDTRLDIGPGDRKWISAKSLNPAATVGVAEGSGVVGTGVSVGTSVSVGGAEVGTKALAVAKAACPVNATTVGRE